MKWNINLLLSVALLFTLFSAACAGTVEDSRRDSADGTPVVHQPGPETGSNSDGQVTMSAAWVGPLVKWNGTLYILSNEEAVNRERLADEVGKVTKRLDMEADVQNGESNFLQPGAALYAIADRDRSEAIAAEWDGRFMVLKPDLGPGEIRHLGEAPDTPVSSDGAVTRPADKDVPDMPLIVRPEDKEGTIMVEGMEETIILRSFRGPQFTTYYPDDLHLEDRETTDGLSGVRFIAGFDGQTPSRAYMEALFFPEGTSEAEALHAVKDAAGTGNTPVEDPYYAWSLVEYSDRNPGGGPLVHHVLTQYNDRYYYFFITYPGEYGDGMHPRIELIFAEWLWNDTGKQLGS